MKDINNTSNKEYIELKDIFVQAESIEVLSEGNSEICAKREGAEFSEIMKAWLSLMETARQMPALGVSIDKLTQEEKKSGLWVEFGFEKEVWVWNMNFTALLVKICPGYRGFNVMRKVDGKYTGRCYYLDLGEGSMSEFYNFLTGFLAERNKRD